MQGIPMLVVSSSVPCLLFANNAPAGEVSQTRPAGLPIPESGQCYLHYIPLTPQRASGAFRLDFEKGRIKNDVAQLPARITQWEHGVTEARIEPVTSGSTGYMDSAPQSWDTLTFLGHTVWLLYYGPLWLVIEDAHEQCVFSQELPGAQTGALHEAGNVFFARGQYEGGEWAQAFALRNSTWQRLLAVEGTSVELMRNGDVTALQHLNDIVGHQITIQHLYSQGRYSQRRSVGFVGDHPRACQTPEQTAQAFLEALLLGQLDEAQSYLTRSLRNDLAREDMLQYLGEFSSIEPSRFGPSCNRGEVALALVSQSPQGLYTARPAAFMLVEEPSSLGPFKIDNIRLL